MGKTFGKILGFALIILIVDFFFGALNKVPREKVVNEFTEYTFDLFVLQKAKEGIVLDCDAREEYKRLLHDNINKNIVEYNYIGFDVVKYENSGIERTIGHNFNNQFRIDSKVGNILTRAK